LKHKDDVCKKFSLSSACQNMAAQILANKMNESKHMNCQDTLNQMIESKRMMMRNNMMKE